MAVRQATQSLDAGAAAEDDRLPAPGAALTPGERVGGVYLVERLLGEGGAGAVYLVRHEGLGGARFALKVVRALPGRSGEVLAREGRLAASVASAHVVKVAALGRLTDGAPYLVMEYVEGTTLEGLLAGRELGSGEAIACGVQLCLALEAAHGQGLLHGDVSLRNVFVTAQPNGCLHVQLGDFGLARRIRHRPGATLSMEVDAAQGTPRFMAPEAIAGDAVDERGDLFAVGVVLYRLLAGAFPFDGESAREILTATLRGAPLALDTRRPDLASLAPLVMRCLDPDPGKRFADARALRRALESVRTAGLRPASRWRGVRSAVARASLAVVLLASVSAAGLHRWREQARIPVSAALECQPTATEPDKGAEELAQAAARAVCAQLGAALDIDWGGRANGATRITSRLIHGGGGFQIELEIEGRLVRARGDTPLAAAQEAARQALARVDRPPMDPEEVRRWGARDAATAAAMRTVWRRRTALIIGDYEQEPRLLLARDPGLPLVHLLLAEVERDPGRRREARAQALAYADRLPPERAAALRATLAIGQTPGATDDALEQLRRAYTAAPDDVDIGVLYSGALAAAGRDQTALAVIARMHARFPERAALAVHYGSGLSERVPGEHAQLVEWLTEVLPESRAVASNIYELVGADRLAEADEALAYARRLGVPADSIAIPAAMVALALGDPQRIERETVAQEGSTRSWSQIVGARLRLAGLLLRGQVAAAETFQQAQLAGRRAAGDGAGALLYGAERLRSARRTGGLTLPPADLAWMEQALADAELPLSAYALVATELIIARIGPTTVAQTGLARLDAELERRADGDALALAAARLRTLPLVRLTRGDAEAASRWRGASAARMVDRVLGAFDAALALKAGGTEAELESAYRLAAAPYDIDRHPFEAMAARLRLGDLLAARGRAGEAAALWAQVDRAWAEADNGLRQAVRGEPAASRPPG